MRRLVQASAPAAGPTPAAPRAYRPPSAVQPSGSGNAAGKVARGRPRHVPGEMNKTEEAYAAHLALQLAAGEIAVEPCHHHGAVGPMAGVVSPSMPVWEVTDDAGPHRSGHQPRHAFATLNEGLGTVLRFGAYGPEVVDRLRWMSEVLGPVLDAAVRASEPIDVTTLIGQALAMGDEGHNRSVAASALLARRLAPAIAPLDGAVEVLRFLAGNDHFALNLSMAAAKLCMDAAAHVPGSSLVTVMSRNGVEFGIRVAGTGDRWFTAPVGPAVGLFFPGYGPEDANPDMGDSAILEAVGLGAFSMAAAPAVAGFVGAGGFREAVATTRAMSELAAARHPQWQIPALEFAGAPIGIDVRRVVETRIAPAINTGIAHKRAGVGQVGAGVARAPLACFDKALDAFRS